jgi:hypothetical protein
MLFRSLKKRPNQRLQPTWQGAAKNDSKCVFLFTGKMLTGISPATRLKRRPLGGIHELKSFTKSGWRYYGQRHFNL